MKGFDMLVMIVIGFVLFSGLAIIAVKALSESRDQFTTDSSEYNITNTGNNIISRIGSYGAKLWIVPFFIILMAFFVGMIAKISKKSI